MRRWLTLFLLIVLPLQFTWVTAASFCQHEKEATTKHIGHHEHQHDTAVDGADARANDVEGDGDPGARAAAGLHADCAFCHLSLAKTLPSMAMPLLAAAPGTHAPASARFLERQLFDRIERPKWARA